jgi:hypothetical protein
MRKRIMTPTRATVHAQTVHAQEDWLDLERAATVEVTSEDKDFPIESSLSIEPRQGWRAAQSGAQTIRLLFDEPQELKRISLVFEENEVTRTQEFVLQASSNTGDAFREIVRQQWNFSPPTSTREIEEYAVELSNIGLLELRIVPDISGSAVRASLKSLRLS